MVPVENTLQNCSIILRMLRAPQLANAVVTTTIRLRFDCDSTAPFRLPFDCNSPRYDHTTTYVMNVWCYKAIKIRLLLLLLLLLFTSIFSRIRRWMDVINAYVTIYKPTCVLAAAMRPKYINRSMGVAGQQSHVLRHCDVVLCDKQ